MRRSCLWLLWIGLAAWGVNGHGLLASAQERVLPPGQVPKDARLAPLKDLNGYFPFTPPKTLDAWTTRSEQLRRRILVSSGLWPMPERTPLNAVVHGKMKRRGFTVEKVYFESFPGHFVTGLLFRPAEGKGPFPAVLSPHGHGGRLQDHGAKKIKTLIEQGQEKYEASGRFPKIARCAQLARMGCVTFIYDMIGYADSIQISRSLAHRFSKQRPDFDTPESWGFFSTQAELRLQSILGLQVWNSIRALDWLCALPDVDPKRVGVTGGSGGGTQTILLGAIDPRPVVAFPQGMVSTSMQGGCTCENACLLRVGTGNVELAALFAPRPQGMTAAKDWTKEMMTKGYPQLKELYQLHGKPDNVICKPFLHFPHNYNYVTRQLMYGWFNRHLKLGLKEPIEEEDHTLLTAEEHSVWDKEHPRPKEGPEVERALTRVMADASDRALAALTPERHRETVRGALEIMIGCGLPGDVAHEEVGKQEQQGFSTTRGLLRRQGAELPVISLLGKTERAGVVLWIDGAGKAGMFAKDGAPRPEVRRLLEAGFKVVGADLLYQGEFLAEGKPVTQTRTVKNKREFAGYTFGYNPTLFAHRVRDILTLFTHVRKGKKVHLLAAGGAGPWAVAVCALGVPVERAAIDTRGFRFRDLKSYRDVNFLPGAVKYGDLPGMLALSAPRPLWLAGEGGKVPEPVAAAYRAAGREDKVRSFDGKPGQVLDAAVDWILGK